MIKWLRAKLCGCQCSHNNAELLAELRKLNEPSPAEAEMMAALIEVGRIIKRWDSAGLPDDRSEVV